MKTDLFQSCGHCWIFQICWHIECSTFTASSFRIWNSSTGIPSSLLALFIVMLPKAHLTLHSRTSDSRWVITPLWLSGSWRFFFVQFFCIFLPSLLNRYDLNQIPYNSTARTTNRFKGLDLIDRVPEELWTKICDIVHRGDQNHPQEKQMQKDKMAVWGGPTNSWEKKRGAMQRRKANICPPEGRVPKDSKER